MKRIHVAFGLLIGMAFLALLSYTAGRARATSWNYAAAQPTALTNSATGAAATVTATLTGSAGRYTYLEGFTVTGAGATGASIVNVTTTGLANNLTYAVTIPAGATTAFTTLDIRFPTPLPATAVNTNITVTCPSAGTGNTNVTISAYGFTSQQ